MAYRGTFLDLCRTHHGDVRTCSREVRVEGSCTIHDLVNGPVRLEARLSRKGRDAPIAGREDEGNTTQRKLSNIGGQIEEKDRSPAMPTLPISLHVLNVDEVGPLSPPAYETEMTLVFMVPPQLLSPE